MKIIRKGLVWFIGFTLLLTTMFPSLSVAAAGPIRIACVGASDVSGIGNGSFPETLQTMLGSGYVVRNYGVGSTTMTKRGSPSYWNTQQFIDSSNWQPDIVIIMLGSNDAKPANWVYKDDYAADYKAMIDHYRGLSSHPTVYMNTLLTCYDVNPNPGSGEITEQIVTGQVVPIIKQVAFEKGCLLNDVNAATKNMPQNFPDLVHPNPAGIQVVAQTTYNGLVLATSDAFSQIEAESSPYKLGMSDEACSDIGGGQNVAYIENGDSAVYYRRDFGNGATGFSARVASASAGGNIEIHLDSVDGPLIGTCPVTNTGGWQSWVTNTVDITGVSGIHDVYLKFTGDTGYLFNLNWFRFTPGYVTPPPVSEPDPEPVALDRTGWTATASNNSGAAGYALDGNVNTRWDTTALQTYGQWYTLDMKEDRTFNSIVMDTTGSAGDYPRGYEVYVSNDGTGFGTPVASGNGYDAVTVVSFPVQTARYIKVVQTGTSGGYWSIHEFYVYGPGSSTPDPDPDPAPLDRTGWTASASNNGVAAAYALDGNADTRWDTTAVQTNGQWYTIDMKSDKTFDTIVLDTTGSPDDYPRGYQVFVSADGTNFGSAIAAGAGTGAVTAITFSPRTARYIRIVQTGSTPSFYWSIHELNIYNSGGGTTPPPAPLSQHTVAIRAAATGKYLTTTDNVSIPAVLSKDTSWGDWEKFIQEDWGNGQITFRAISTWKYLTVNTEPGTILPNSATIGTASRFSTEDRGNGKYAIRAAVNNRYLSNGAGNQLRANAVSVGANEEFYLVNLDPIPSETSYVGVTMGFTGQTLNGASPTYSGNTTYNMPLYNATSDNTKFWDNIVEEIASSGVDFVAPTIRGYLDSVPDYNNAGDPRKLADMIAAMNRRGLTDKFKFSCLDDNPASMTDHKNRDNGGGGYNPKFDVGDPDNYKYIWEYNYKAFFNTVPDNMRFKIDGRPVIWEWVMGDYAFTNYGNGNSKALLMYIRQKCQEEFGFNPYIIVEGTWLNCDPAVDDPAVIDGVHSWFMVGPGYSTTNYNGRSYGALVPGFRVVNGGANMFLDSNHGQTLKDNLDRTVGSGSLVTLVEGFTDWEENCTLWRSTDTTYYDYPNQRINILRRYSSDPFPEDLKMEAEACDSFSDTTYGNAGNVYRSGNLDIQATTDTHSGWNVFNTAAGEWLQWQEVPLQGSTDLKVRVAAAAPGGQIRFVIDGVAGPAVSVPNTGGAQTWQTIDAGNFDLAQGSYHTVRLEVVSGNVGINYWTN